MTSFGFEDKNNDKAKYDEEQQEDTFPFSGILLISVRDRSFKLDISFRVMVTYRVAIVSSLTESSICTAVCSMLNSTLSNNVP